MGRPKPTRPTDGELAILNVLWKREAALTIRQIVADLKKPRPYTYATVQTLVRIMEKKGLVKRGPERYPALYSPASPEEISKKQMLHEFIDRVFGGSMKQMVMHALASKKSSTTDIDEIEKLIDRMEE